MRISPVTVGRNEPDQIPSYLQPTVALASCTIIVAMGRYVIDRVVAEGAQGRLYRAKDLITNQICILKTGESVKNEALLALEMNHPYIARPFDYGIDPEIGAYAAYPEYSEPSLLEWTEKKAKKDDLRRVALQMGEFLAFLHHRGWLYNDFKPGHFLISDQSIRVLDLGLCTRMDEPSSTFFGTFPYISPERLAGRLCDARSDIFALGMILMHALLPHERWDYEPSIQILQELPKRVEALPQFWSKLLSEMTSFEPAQRIETAEELWNRLVPSELTNLLFFPFPICFSIPDSIHKERVVVVQAGSKISLKEAETQALSHSWSHDISTALFDFRNQRLEDCFTLLCKTYSEEIPSDFFSAIDFLSRLRLDKEKLLLFWCPESLSSEHRALFSYAITTLNGRSCFRFLVITTRPLTGLSDDSCKRVEIPVLTKKDLEQILQSAFPSNGTSKETAKKYLARSFSIPEQLVAEFRKNLSPDYHTFWPAAAKEYFLPSGLESLRPIEMRTLGCFAISGGLMRKEDLFLSLKVREDQGLQLVHKLESNGYLQWRDGNEYFLTLPSQSILGRLRKDRIRQIAESMLTAFKDCEDRIKLYNISKFAENKQAAASLSLEIANSLLLQHKSDNAQEWFWKAFCSDAKLPKEVYYKLLRHCLLRVQVRRIRKLSNYVSRTFGRSFPLLEITLDLLHRTNRFKDAIHLSEQGIKIASKRKNQFAFEYFTTRLAGFLILDYRLDDGEKIIEEILINKSNTSSSWPGVQGLAHHFLGLSNMYRGNFEKALAETTLAAGFEHRFRTSSVMNIGAALIRLGKSEEAESPIRKAIKIFTRQNDLDRLCLAHNNLGIAKKLSGKTKDARNSYFHALQLSSVCKNINIKLHILANLAITYESEGRTAYAIRYHSKAASLAKEFGFRVQMGIALINAGAQYSILGQYKSAVGRLTKALEIVGALDLQFEVASAYESLGLTYLLSKHFRKAADNFGRASTAFHKAGADKDYLRSQIYLGLSLAEDGGSDRAAELLSRITDPIPDSFEDGLRKYALAYCWLRLRELKENSCRDYIHEAEAIFRKIPNLFWLGRLQKLKAEYLIETDHFEKASISLESAYNIFSRLGAKKEVMNLSKAGTISKVSEDFLNRMAERLPYKILLMIKEVLGEPDPDKMISRILSASLEFTDMERAVLMLDENPPRVFKSATLDESTIKEIHDISNSAMDEATESKKPYVRLDAVSDPYLKSKPSILASRIMSIVCLPLKTSEKSLGVLYLDSREGVETLANTETVLLEIFAAIISLALNKSLVLEKSLAENEDLRASLGLMQFPEIIGKSEPMMKVLKIVNQLLQTELPVLITGETGTGKEMIARVLHHSGKRKNGAFLAVNCSAITKSLLESELFGHEKGSFTGAMNQKKGLFEQARGGTLFLDEIGEMPYSMQAKLLRVLQEGEFRRVGGNETLHTDVRLVLATNRNLQEMVKQERFREDLFYRIKGAQVHLPALRDRPQDIPLLVSSFLDAANKTSGRGIVGFTSEALDLLKAYSWPGNIRQLKNEVERVVALAQADWIKPEDLDEELRASQKLDTPKKGTLRDRERQVIIESLDENKWNIVQTARILGLTRNGLYGKMKLHGIPKKSVE